MLDSIDTNNEDTGNEETDCERFTKCKSCPAYDRFDGDLEKYYNGIERDIENVSSQLKNIEFLYYSINVIIVLFILYFIVFHVVIKYMNRTMY